MNIIVGYHSADPQVAPEPCPPHMPDSKGAQRKIGTWWDNGETRHNGTYKLLDAGFYKKGCPSEGQRACHAACVVRGRKCIQFTQKYDES